jgi:hypothetical protein
MGVAIFIVNHLRLVATQLHEILPRYTQMPVELITEGLVLQPNRVFILPEKPDLHVWGGESKANIEALRWPDVITVSAFLEPALRRPIHCDHRLRQQSLRIRDRPPPGRLISETSSRAFHRV